MNVTDAFLGEHAVFYAQFDYMEKIIPVATSVLQVKTQGAMLKAALAGHAQLEEELLFKNLESHIGPQGPLAVMRAEHDEIERSLESLPGIKELPQAQALLLNPSLNIGQIAISVGFSDIYYFSRAFKKHFGQTPTQMQKKMFAE